MNQEKNVEFVTPVKCVYRFEESQKIKVKLFDCDLEKKGIKSSQVNTGDSNQVDYLGESEEIELAQIVNGYPVAGQWSGSLNGGPTLINTLVVHPVS